MLREGNAFAEFCEGLRKEHEPLIRKTTYDAFYKTQLEELLRARGANAVVIAGVLTHLCCETTARAAFVRDFEVYVLVDATATYTEELHLAALQTLSHACAVPLLVSDLELCAQK